jgi:hypothetical protein
MILSESTVEPNSGGVTEVIIANGGASYTGRASVVIGPPPAGGLQATASASIENGTITAIAMEQVGAGYVTAPPVTINDPGIPGTPPIPGGGGFTGTAVLSFGQVVNVNLVEGGSNYTSLPVVSIIGDGTGAEYTAIIQGQAVIGFIQVNSGTGYTKALAVIEGGNNAANATPFLMPFGVSGTTIETYQARVWVSNGAATAGPLSTPPGPPQNRTLYSSPQSPVDFGDGGGVFQSFDSFLRVGYHSLKQANGFLYLIGDSSMNYISGVTTTDSASANTVATPITTFSNQNVDPQLGSPWPSSVQVFSRNVVFANSIGIFASTGGAIEKISTPLDGFYGSGPIYGNTSDFPSAIATIFGTSVYMLLLPVIDSFSGGLTNKLLMWDGKRLWTSEQDRTLTYIATQELNSVLTAWGTDGTNIFPLFQNPTTGFVKTMQSKLFSDPAYFLTKTTRSLSGMVYSFVLDGDLNVTIDSEAGLGTGNASVTVQPSPSGVWVNNSDVVGSWINNSSVPGFWGGPGLVVFGPIPVGQNGRLTGFTVITAASNLALLSLMLSEQTFATNL